MGASEGGPLSMLFSGAHPERTTGLILMGAEVRERTDEDWPWGEGTEEEFEAAMAALRDRWGKPRPGAMSRRAPSQEDTPWMRDWTARLQTNSNTPASAEAFIRMAFEIGVRDIASSIQVPTLILHAEGDRVCHVENGRFLARQIPDARYVELSGADHSPWFQPERVIAEIREFLTGYRVAEAPDRVLAKWETVDGVSCSKRTTQLYETGLLAFAVPRSAPPVTVSWRPSTGRRGRSAPRNTSPPRCTNLGRK